MGTNKTDSTQKDIKRYFGFLFEKGFSIRDSRHQWQSFGNWQVVLESANCVIEIYRDRNELNLVFAPLDEDRKSRIGILPMIYFLSQEQNFIGPYEGNLFWGKKRQFERLASLLKEYIDQILPYFGNDFVKYKNDLLLSQRKYNDLLVEKYARKLKTK